MRRRDIKLGSEYMIKAKGRPWSSWPMRVIAFRSSEDAVAAGASERRTICVGDNRRCEWITSSDVLNPSEEFRAAQKKAQDQRDSLHERFQKAGYTRVYVSAGDISSSSRADWDSQARPSVRFYGDEVVRIIDLIEKHG